MGEYGWLDRNPCGRCGHGLMHHRGFNEPGCSYGGTCECPRWQRPTDPPPNAN